MATRALPALLIAIATGALAFAPAGAAATAPVTPTTVSQKQINKQTADTLRPLVIVVVIAVILSALADSVGRKKRRRKRSRKSQPKSRRPRSSPARKPKRVRTPAPRNRAPTPAPAPPPPPVPTSSDDAHLWGRSAGASAAERAEQLERERRNWAAGSEGEQRVGAELDRLPTGEWWVFHDVRRGASGTNVDHLVIGVGGVFSLNTKNVTGHVWVAERALMINGAKTHYLPAAASEARDVARRLARVTSWNVRVDPVLVFIEPVTIRAMPADVTVLDLANVREWLRSRPTFLTPQQAYEIVRAADQPATWA